MPTDLIEYLKSMSIHIGFNVITSTNHINGCFSAHDFNW